MAVILRKLALGAVRITLLSPRVIYRDIILRPASQPAKVNQLPRSTSARDIDVYHKAGAPTALLNDDAGDDDKSRHYI